MTTTLPGVSVKNSSASAPPPRLNSVTGIRFIAAAIVFFFHARGLGLFSNETIANGYNFIIDNTGNLAVSMFFVLSGFVLTWSWRDGETTRGYYRRRVLKVFPNHIIMWGVALGVAIAFTATPQFNHALASLFLLTAWIPDPELSFIFGTVNGPTWSLSVELLFYLLLPVFLVLVRKIRPERLWAWVIGISAVAVALPFVSDLFLSTSPEYPYLPGMSAAEMWFYCFGPILRMVEFVIGMLVARIILNGRWINVGILTATAACAVAFVIGRLAPPPWGLAIIYPFAVALLIGALATSDIRKKSTWIGSRPMTLLGNISFAFFLVHVPMLDALHNIFGEKVITPEGAWVVLDWGTWGGIGFLIGAFALTTLCGWLLWRFVEEPIMRKWGRSKVELAARAKAKAEAEAAAATAVAANSTNVETDSAKVS
jgi:peptidoglycan/LPS O-acetylase OafA/YrhL